MNPQLEELACLYVLDRLDARERTSFEASMQTDSELAAFVREIESTLEQRIRALPGLEPPAGLLARIEARVDRLPARLSPEQPRTAAPLWVSISRWGIAALLLLGFGAMEFRHLQRNPAAAARPIVVFVGLDSRQSMLSEVPLRQRPKDADASFVQLASLAEQMWEKPSDLPVKLHSTGQAGEATRSSTLPAARDSSRFNNSPRPGPVNDTICGSSTPPLGRLARPASFHLRTRPMDSIFSLSNRGSKHGLAHWISS